MCALVSLMCLVCREALAEEATYSTRVKVFQKYAVDVSGLTNTFEYLVTPKEAEYPLPVDESGNPVSSFELRRDEERWLEFSGTVDRDATPVTYRYTLEPKTPTLTDGLFYVDVLSANLEAGVNTYYLEVYVATDGDDLVAVPLVHIEGWDGPKISDPGWRIDYKKPEEPKEDPDPDSGKTPSRTPEQKPSQDPSIDLGTHGGDFRLISELLSLISNLTPNMPRSGIGPNTGYVSGSSGGVIVENTSGSSTTSSSSSSSSIQTSGGSATSTTGSSATDAASQGVASQGTASQGGITQGTGAQGAGSSGVPAAGGATQATSTTRTSSGASQGQDGLATTADVTDEAGVWILLCVAASSLLCALWRMRAGGSHA